MIPHQKFGKRERINAPSQDNLKPANHLELTVDYYYSDLLNATGNINFFLKPLVKWHHNANIFTRHSLATNFLLLLFFFFFFNKWKT